MAERRLQEPRRPRGLVTSEVRGPGGRDSGGRDRAAAGFVHRCSVRRVFVGLCALLASGFLSPLVESPASAQSSDQSSSPPIPSAPPSSAPAPSQAPARTVGDTAQAPALIAAMNRTVLAAELSATISELTKRPGESFAKGDLLVRFSCGSFEAQRDVGRADVAAAEAQLRVKRRLFDLQSVGAMDVELAEAGLRKAEAQVRQYQVEVERCTVHAPYRGRVVEWKAQPYSSVEAGSELMEIVGVERLEIEVIVPSDWLEWIEPGAPFTVQVEETSAPIEATVRRIGAVVDPASQTVVIRGSIDGGDGTLLPGMRGRARFSRENAS